MKILVKRVKQWTESERNYIEDNYLNMSDEEISKKLDGRTPKAVRSERQKMNLYRPKVKKSANKGIREKATWETAIEMMEKRGYSLLSDSSEFKNGSSKLRYLCPKHVDKGELAISYSHLKEGKGCPYCGRERTALSKVSTVSPEDDRKLCEQKGFTYVKTEKIKGRYYIFFICKKHEILGIQKMTRGNMTRESVKGCQYCIGRNLPHWYVKQIIETKYPNYKVLSKYLGMNSPLTCYCTKHNTTFTCEAKYIISLGRGCNECSHEKKVESCKLSIDEVITRVKEANPDVEIVDPDSYLGCEFPLEIRCKKCGHIWSPPLSSMTANGIRCPTCSPEGYKGEIKISSELSKRNLIFQRQYKIPACKNKRVLPFDFAILNDKEELLGLIEYQGEQHYFPVKHFGGEQKFKDQQQRDTIKVDYCNDNNIPLLEIPYWNYNNIDEIIAKFLHEIK